MATTTLAAGVSMTRVCQPNEEVAYQGTLTGTSTLTATMLHTGGTSYVPFASDTIGTTAGPYSATFPTLVFVAPANGCTLKLANTSGSGSWVIEGAL